MQKFQGINLALIMCGQLMDESHVTIATAQNQTYFMDKWQRA